MFRKVNLVGSNTLTISLPNKWVKKHNIQKGDDLFLNEEDSALTIAKNKQVKKELEYEVNLDELDYYELIRKIQLLYKSNYHKIILYHNKKEINYIKNDANFSVRKTIKELCSRFIGLEIISQSSHKTELVVLEPIDKPDLKQIQLRVNMLLEELFETLIHSIDEHFEDFNDNIYSYHHNISKFIAYYERNLIQLELKDTEKFTQYSLYTCLDIVLDKLRDLSKRITQFGATKKVKTYTREIFNFFLSELKEINKKKMDTTFIRKRHELKNKILKESFTVKEYKIISEAMFLLNFKFVLWEAQLNKVMF